jgi:hypothetical protein
MSTAEDRLALEAVVIREMVRHEDELTSQRMSAFLTIQGLLFAALGFGWDKSWVLVSGVLAPAGVVICLSCRSTLILGPMTVGDLLRRWDETSKGYAGPDVVGARFDFRGWRQLIWPWNAIPLALGLAWVAAGVLRVAS